MKSIHARIPPYVPNACQSISRQIWRDTYETMTRFAKLRFNPRPPHFKPATMICMFFCSLNIWIAFSRCFKLMSPLQTLSYWGSQGGGMINLQRNKQIRASSSQAYNQPLSENDETVWRQWSCHQELCESSPEFDRSHPSTWRLAEFRLCGNQSCQAIS